MPPKIENLLTPENGYIFRITHRDNIPWILRNGLACATDRDKDPAFVNIGSSDLISRRATHPVSIPPGGTLGDYIPFYFTPFSPMAFNIHTGRGVPKRSNDELVFLMTSASRITAAGLPFVFTDRHAYLQTARFFVDLIDLTSIDFPILQRRDFQRSETDPEKVDRYMAEFLVKYTLPVTTLLCVACYTEESQLALQATVDRLGLAIPVLSRPGWYFR